MIKEYILIMQKREVFYLGIIFVLVVGLIFSIFSLFDLKSKISREEVIQQINAQLNQQQLSELFEDKLKRDGFYIPPVPVILGNGGSGGNIYFYNKFDKDKSFTFSFNPNTTLQFPYSGMELLKSPDPIILRSGESGVIPFMLNAKGDFSSGNKGQYLVEVLANNEKIGQDSFFILVVTEEQIKK